MEPEDIDPLPPLPAGFMVLGATLTLLAAVPLAFWLADAELLPWASELRWNQLRQGVTAAPMADDDQVILERAGCFGACPVYEVRIYATGLVQFTGVSFVCEKGAHTAQIDPVLARDLLSDLNGGGFRELAWNTGALLADAPSTFTTLVRGGHSLRLERLFADTNAPRLLVRMEETIDTVAGSARWRAKRIGRDWFCDRPDGSQVRLYDLEHPKT
jgi:hypothetical protein